MGLWSTTMLSIQTGPLLQACPPPTDPWPPSLPPLIHPWGSSSLPGTPSYSHVGSSTQNTHCRVTFFCGDKKNGHSIIHPVSAIVRSPGFSGAHPVFSLPTSRVPSIARLSILSSLLYLSFLLWPTLHILFTTHRALLPLPQSGTWQSDALSQATFPLQTSELGGLGAGRESS